MSSQISTQPLYREVGIDNPHQHTDEEQQYQNLDGIVKEKVYGRSQRRVGTQAEQTVNQPVCKILYHVSILINSLKYEHCFHNKGGR